MSETVLCSALYAVESVDEEIQLGEVDSDTAVALFTDFPFTDEIEKRRINPDLMVPTISFQRRKGGTSLAVWSEVVGEYTIWIPGIMINVDACSDVNKIVSCISEYTKLGEFAAALAVSDRFAECHRSNLLGILEIANDFSLTSLRAAMVKRKYNAVRPFFEADDLIPLLRERPEFINQWDNYCSNKRTNGGYWVDLTTYQIGSLVVHGPQKQLSSPEETIAQFVVHELNYWADIRKSPE